MTHNVNRSVELGAILARHYPGASPHRVALLIEDAKKLAARSKRWGEKCCNKPVGDLEAEFMNRRLEEARAEIEGRLSRDCLWNPPGPHSSAAHPSPAVLTIGGDPLSPCCWIKVPGMPGDGWDREEGFGVY